MWEHDPSTFSMIVSDTGDISHLWEGVSSVKYADEGWGSPSMIEKRYSVLQ